MIERRRANLNDAATLATLRGASLIELGKLQPARRADFVERATRDFARLLSERRVAAWVLCDGATIVGTAYANFFERLPFPEGTVHAEVSGVYVAPGYRGQGHATRLVAAVLDDVRRSPARKTFLRPSAAAHTLYERLGFVDDATGVMSLPG